MLQPIILAAGKGTRLNEGKASPIPKVLYEVKGKPMIFYLLETLEKIDTVKPILVIGYKGEDVQKVVGYKAQYVWQKEQLGTGHAVMQAQKTVEQISHSEGEARRISSRSFAPAGTQDDNRKTHDSVLILYGDMPYITTKTLKNLRTLHEKKQPIITMLTVEFDDPNYYAFGRIVRNNKGEITGIVEQKVATNEEKRIKECNTGVYIFDSSWLWKNISKIKPQSHGEYYLTDLIALAVQDGKSIIALKSKNTQEFLGVNTQEQLREAERII